MLTVVYTKTFLKKFSKIDTYLQDEVCEKINVFKDEANHSVLRVHKLKKPFVEVFSFSVNYKIRILFRYIDSKKTKVAFLTIGSHDQVYKNGVN